MSMPQDEYMARLLLIKSDPRCYTTLITDMENQYTRGCNGYPRTFISAYNRLVRFRNLQSTIQLQNQDGGMGFMQDDDDDPQHERSSRIASSGHGSSGDHRWDSTASCAGH